jgi:hypothetical protein
MELNVPAVVAILKTRVAAQDVALSDLRKEIVQMGKDAARTDRLHRAALDAAEVSIAAYDAELVAEHAEVLRLQRETLTAHALRVWRNWWRT